MEQVRFSQLYKIPSGNGLSRPSAVRGVGFKMVGMGELFANDIINDMPMDRVQMSDKELIKYTLEPDDLLFARQSLVAEGAGKCSIVKSLAETTTYESHLIRVRLNKKIANPWYYFYLFKLPSNPIKSIINQCAQAGIRGKELEKVKLPLPDINTQNNTVKVLSKYDELIEINNKRIKLLEQTAEELYKEWFVRFRFPNYQNTEFENGIPNGWHFGDETNKKRPKGWEYAKFEKIGSFKRGKNITASEMVEGDIPVISAGIEPSGFHNQSNVQGKSLTLSASGANAGYLKYNLDDIWAADCLYYQNDDIIWLVYNTLKFLQPVISNMQCGAAQPHVYPKNISRLCVVIPPKAIIDEFCKIVSPFYDEIKQLKQQNENLIKQRDLLLPRLMSGKLEVK